MQYLALIWELAKVDFKLRYSSSSIGYLWALLKPLLIFLIINFVFANIFRPQLPNYSLHLLVGIVLWTFFTEGTTAGMNSLLAKGSLISKVATSKTAIIVAATVNSSMTFLINAVIVGFFFALYGVMPSVPGLLLGMVLVGLAYGLILGISLALSPLYVRWRDINQIWEVLLMLGFYGAPIIYPLNVIPAQVQQYLWLNPMSYLIHYAKLALINHQLISPSRLAILIGAVATTLIVGSLVFRRQHRRLAEFL